MKSEYFLIKKEAYEANMEIPQRGLAIYTWGNVSAFDPERKVFAIKPSGVPYEDLEIDNMVVVDLDGNIIEGSFRPSSDTLTHCSIYKGFGLSENLGKIKGVSHTHSTYAVAWAQAQQSIPAFGTTYADHAPFTIPCTTLLSEPNINNNYELETGKLIISSYANPPKDFMKICSNINKTNNITSINPIENPMVLVGGHGPFTWGETPSKAIYNAAVLEETAKMAYLTIHINNKAKQLPNYVINKHYERKHGKNAYYGQTSQ